MAACYRNSLALAQKYRAKTIAFPAISTGVYRFPKPKAAGIALTTVRDLLEKTPGVFEKVIFVLFSDPDLEIYQSLLPPR